MLITAALFEGNRSVVSFVDKLEFLLIFITKVLERRTNH